jgi:sigma-B regulation protein RsbU (phosphoserine phosphatase)
MIQDMTRARELQMSMLPSQDLCVQASNGMTLIASGACYPTELVGGDYYDYFSLPDDKVGLVIGDVMGHGFHTGLMVSTAKSCLHTQVKTDSSVSGVLSTMNDMVYGFVHGDLFMSFCYIIVDLIGKTLSFCNAGHCYPYHYIAKTGHMEALESNSCLLGVLEYQYFEGIDRGWETGDLLVMYTDGITEAQNADNESFGEGRLKQLIAENPDLSPSQLKRKVFQELSNFCSKARRMDDTSLAVVKLGD